MARPRIRPLQVWELAPEGTLTGAWIQSPHSHARVQALEARWAKESGQLEAILISEEMAPPRRDLLALQEVVFAGDPVAVIAASEASVVESAVGRFDIQYEGEPYWTATPTLLPDSPLDELLGDSRILSRVRHQRGGDGEGGSWSIRLRRHLPGWTRRALEPGAALAIPEPRGSLQLISSAVDGQGRFGSWLRHIVGAAAPKVRLEPCADGCSVPRRVHWETDALAILLASQTKKPVLLPLPPSVAAPASAAPLPASAGCQVTIDLQIGSDGRPIRRRVRAIIESGGRLPHGFQPEELPEIVRFLPFEHEDWDIAFVASHRPPTEDCQGTLDVLCTWVTTLSERATRSGRPEGGDGLGWRVASELSKASLPSSAKGEALFGVGHAIGRAGTGWIVHEVALALDRWTARPSPVRWRVRNYSELGPRSLRAQIVSELEWLWRLSTDRRTDELPTVETLPAIEIIGPGGSQGLAEADRPPGVAAAAYLDALQSILTTRSPERLPLSSSDLFERLHA
ncbi:MAG: hypothetical protein RL885_12575 [Planctomycetota bacterium]